MKRVITRFSPVCLLLSAFMGGVLAARAQQADSLVGAPIGGALVTEWKGSVRISLPSQTPSDPSRGEQLPVGTILDTGNGKLLLRLSDGSEVLIRPHSKIQLQQPSLGDPSYLHLLLGRIRALINKRTGGTIPFELGTPSAVIAVRGTQFDVEVNRRNVTEVDVIDGLVEVSGRNSGAASVLLEPGFSTRISTDSGPEPPQPTHEIRPEVERPDPQENEARGRSEMETEFDRVDKENEVAESAGPLERTEMPDVLAQDTDEGKPEAMAGSEPQ